MPARVTHKRFDAHTGAIFVTVEDDLGARTVHTIHVLQPDGSEADVAAVIAAALSQADERAARVRAAFEKHGWTPR
jgi:hypothetical protein